MASPQRLLRLDLIRVVSMVMVVLLHTILNFTVRPDFFGTKLYFILEPFIALSKTSVLLFFMLSGYLVLSKRRTLQENTRKSVLRIATPLCFFTIINILWDYKIFRSMHYQGVSFWTIELQKIQQFPHSSLWFLEVLLPIYLLNPVWQRIFTDQYKKYAISVLSLVLIFSLSATLLAHWRQIPIFNVYTAWTGFLFFYWYGGMVYRQWVVVTNKYWNYFSVVTGFLATVAGDAVSSFNIVHGIISPFTHYTDQFISIPVSMMAVGIFNILISVEETSLQWWWAFQKGWLQQLAELSFGIYLLHPYMVTALTEGGFDLDHFPVPINIYIFILANVSTVLGSSIILTHLIKRSNKLKWMIGA